MARGPSVVDRVLAWTRPRSTIITGATALRALAERRPTDREALEAENQRLRVVVAAGASRIRHLEHQLAEANEAIAVRDGYIAEVTHDDLRMRPRRTHFSDKVFRLPGGNEDNDLWTTIYPPSDGGPAIGSTWAPTDKARAAIAAGCNVELLVFSEVQQPVAMRVVDYPLGKRPEADAA